MSIASVDVRRFGGPLGAGAMNARRAWKEREGLLLVLRNEDGEIGLGEASPLPGFSPDTIEGCEATLRDMPAGRIKERAEGESIEAWLTAAARLLDPNAPAARFALETALLDLEGRRAGVSIASLLAGRDVKRTVPLAALLSGEEEGDVIESARRALRRGIRTLKWKIGRAGRFDEELETVRALRREIGPEPALRLDGNGAWDLVEGEKKLAALAEFGLEFVEQPVVPYLLLKLGGSPVTVAADETLALPGAVERLNLVPACRVLVVKPMVLGGFVPALRMMKIAKARRYGVVVSHLFDGPVALAAAAELALGLPVEPLACGLDRHAGLGAWPAARVPRIEEASIVPFGPPGHGIEPTEVLS
ncbi:MAG: enolase C-terminal domain-like protein [Candidatus Eisenbacteria bacterium]